MRTIKFRAFWKEAKIMVDVESIRKNGAIEFLVPVKSGEKEWKEVQILDEQVQYELMQFTGLSDKNNEEIYEGEILKTESGICSVVWEERAAGFRFLFGGNSESPLNYDDVEVIGNIYENPELLK